MRNKEEMTITRAEQVDGGIVELQRYLEARPTLDYCHVDAATPIAMTELHGCKIILSMAALHECCKYLYLTESSILCVYLDFD